MEEKITGMTAAVLRAVAVYQKLKGLGEDEAASTLELAVRLATKQAEMTAHLVEVSGYSATIVEMK